MGTRTPGAASAPLRIGGGDQKGGVLRAEDAWGGSRVRPAAHPHRMQQTPRHAPDTRHAQRTRTACTSTPGWAPEPRRTHRTHISAADTLHTHGTPLAPHRERWTHVASTRPPRHASDTRHGHQTPITCTRPPPHSPDPPCIPQPYGTPRTPTARTGHTLHAPDPPRAHRPHICSLQSPNVSPSSAGRCRSWSCWAMAIFIA